MVLESLSKFIARKLKEEKDPKRLLAYLEAIDKLYFQSLLKNEMCSSLFEILYSADEALFSKHAIAMPENLKKELELWVKKHGGQLFK